MDNERHAIEGETDLLSKDELEERLNWKAMVDECEYILTEYEWHEMRKAISTALHEKQRAERLAGAVKFAKEDVPGDCYLAYCEKSCKAAKHQRELYPDELMSCHAFLNAIQNLKDGDLDG